ncbi:hypothetical protein HYFRA_00006706 [Hymenoscyphus fraxineus]|uniref:Uncharacterized protein n=1 Tax=Hymenoscyphus fraxineus TaxID=746836 RepID=A0A9N9KUN8_9HELO|nr:hypothetical protein HYFRA_00006706 [Hymenoscyphus fraxineus]
MGLHDPNTGWMFHSSPGQSKQEIARNKVTGKSYTRFMRGYCFALVGVGVALSAHTVITSYLAQPQDAKKNKE